MKGQVREFGRFRIECVHVENSYFITKRTFKFSFDKGTSTNNRQSSGANCHFWRTWFHIGRCTRTNWGSLTRSLANQCSIANKEGATTTQFGFNQTKEHLEKIEKQENAFGGEQNWTKKKQADRSGNQLESDKPELFNQGGEDNGELNRREMEGKSGCNFSHSFPRENVDRPVPNLHGKGLPRTRQAHS